MKKKKCTFTKKRELSVCFNCPNVQIKWTDHSTGICERVYYGRVANSPKPKSIEGCVLVCQLEDLKVWFGGSLFETFKLPEDCSCRFEHLVLKKKNAKKNRSL